MLTLAGVPEPRARAIRAGVAALLLVLGTVGMVDRTISLSLLDRRLLLWAGIASATAIVWALQYAMHHPVTRRALVPWGTLGGFGLVLIAAAQSREVFDHTAFVMTTALRALFATVGLRLAIDAARGPLRAPWEEQQVTLPNSEANPAYAIPDDAWYDVLRQPAPQPEAKADEHVELRLVEEKNEDQPTPPTKRKSGGTHR